MQIPPTSRVYNPPPPSKYTRTSWRPFPLVKVPKSAKHNRYGPTKDDDQDANGGHVQLPRFHGRVFAPLELLANRRVRIAIYPSFDGGASVLLGFEHILALDDSASWIGGV